MKFQMKTLTKLTPDEKRAVVAMVLILLKELDKPQTELIIGDYADKLVMHSVGADYKKKICENLVEKGIFVRHDGETVVSTHYSQPVGEDNWYSFNAEFIEWMNKQDYYHIIGGFIFELEYKEAREYRGAFYTFATRGLLQSTYL